MGAMDAAALAMQGDMAYGQAHRARMFQSQFAGFDAAGVAANNPMMAMGSQFGETGSMVAMMAQTMFASHPTMGPLMQRLMMPPGTDLGAAARFRTVQMTTARMGMGGISDVYGAALGMKPGDPGYGIIQALPMFDQMSGGLIGKIANMVDENLITTNGSAALINASQFQRTMGVLNPENAMMLQASLMGHTRANAAGRSFDAVADFGKEKEFRLRNQAFTAGFTNDEMSMATLFAQQQGSMDTELMRDLRDPANSASTKRKVRAQLAAARNQKIEDIKDEDVVAATDTYIRNEGAVSGGSFAARGARRIQQGLLQNAQMPQLLAFMEGEHIQLRNEKDVSKLDETVIQLQALARAAAMSTEALIKNASALQQNYGGTTMYHATALAAGQSMDRTFRLAGGNTEIAGSYTGELTQRHAEAAGSQFAARLAYRTILDGPAFAARVASDPAGVQREIENMGAVDASNARLLQQDPAAMAAGMRALQDGSSPGAVYALMNRALLDNQRKELRVGSVRLTDGKTVTGVELDAGFEKLMADKESRRLVSTMLTNRAGEGLTKDEEATLNDRVQQTMGMSMRELKALTLAKTMQGGNLRGIAQGYSAEDNAENQAADLKRFAEVQHSLIKLGKLNVVRGGTAMLGAKLLDPKFDVMSYGEDWGKLGVDAGLFSPDDQGKAVAALNEALKDPRDRESFATDIRRYAKARSAFARTEGQDEGSKARTDARTELTESAAAMRQYNFNIDPNVTMSDADRKEADERGLNTTALKELTAALTGLAQGLGVKISGGGALPTADTPPAAKDSAKTKSPAEKELVVKVFNTVPGVSVEVGQSQGDQTGVKTTAPSSAPRSR